VLEGTFGVLVSEDLVYVPDLMAVPAAALDGDVEGALPADVRLAVEVLAPGDVEDHDVEFTREQCARAGIPHYWIVDPQERMVRVLTLTDGAYADTTVVGPNEMLRIKEPFRVEFYPRELF
jgi:Uma2 family endonuclease